MFTIDRLNKILRYYGGEPVSAHSIVTTGDLWQGTHNTQPCHTILDDLDRWARICTDGLYVGARLALHENMMARGAPEIASG